jgi:hypothetical protein
MEIRNEFDTIRPLLRLTDRLSDTYPHPTSDTSYRVIYYKEDDIFGVHPDEDIEQIQLTKQDLIEYELDMRKFREVLSKLLGFQESHEKFQWNDRLIPLGIFELTAGQTYPVLLIMAPDPGYFSREVFHIFATKTSPIILITPTDRWWTKEIIELFQKNKSALVLLRDIIEVDDSNCWKATDVWRETLLNFRNMINPPNLVEVPSYEFRKRGEMWVIRYEGEDMYLKDSVGLQCISQLLSKPNDPVFVMELRAIVSGQRPEMVTQSQSRDDVVDQETLTDLKRRYLELQVDLEDSQRDRNDILEKEIEEEMEQIVQYLCQVKAKGGETRKMSDDFEKARSATSKAFWRAVNLIRNELPQLATHLEKCCVVGMVCNYDPEHKINWVL